MSKDKCAEFVLIVIKMMAVIREAQSSFEELFEFPEATGPRSYVFVD